VSPESHNSIHGGLIVGIVLGLIVLNVIIVYCYRRYTRREMHDEMKMQIESAISQYHALSRSGDGQPFFKR